MADNTTAGGNKRGVRATDLQKSRAMASQVASGPQSVIAGGSNNTAHGNEAVVTGGASNTASAQNSTVGGGTGNIADANNSWIPGGANATTRGLFGRGSVAAGRFVMTGDAQWGMMVMRRQTTDATATVLTSDGGTPGTGNQVILPNECACLFRVDVVARRTDADNESAGFAFQGVIDRNAGAGTVALVGTPTKTVLAEDVAAWDANVTADVTNGGLAVTVTGEAAKTINWVAVARLVEVVG
jgi:hypothetical protein